QRLARDFDFEGKVLTRAFTATFRVRRTPLPPVTPSGLCREFAEDASRQTQWRGFLNRNRLQGEQAPELAITVDLLREFLMPPLKAAACGCELPLSWSRQSLAWGNAQQEDAAPGSL